MAARAVATPVVWAARSFLRALPTSPHRISGRMLLLTSLGLLLLPVDRFCWCWIPSGAAMIAPSTQSTIAAVLPVLPCTIRVSGVLHCYVLCLEWYPGCTSRNVALTCHLPWLCSGCIAFCPPGSMTACSPAKDSASMSIHISDLSHCLT